MQQTDRPVVQRRWDRTGRQRVVDLLHPVRELGEQMVTDGGVVGVIGDVGQLSRVLVEVVELDERVVPAAPS